MKKLYTIICIAILIFVLKTPEICTNGMVTGIKLVLYTVIPALFPFLIFTNFLLKYNLFTYISSLFYPLVGKIFKVSRNGCFAVLTGFLCGYPIGVKTARSLYEKNCISDSEYRYIIKFCNNPSLAFVLSYVSYSLLSNQVPDILLILCVYGSSILTGIIFRKTVILSETGNPDFLSSSTTNIFEDTTRTLITLSGYILVFSILSNYFLLFLPAKIIKPIIISTTEITMGLNYLCSNYNPSAYIPLIIICLIFGGFSITAQTFSILKTNTEKRDYLLGKISCILCGLLIYSFIHLIQ